MSSDAGKIDAFAGASQSAAIWALEATTDNVILLDRDFRVTYINRATAELNGITPESVLGRSIWEVWPGNLGTDIERNYRRAMAEGVPIRFLHSYVEPGRFDLWLEINAYPSPDGLAIFFHDISELRRQATREIEDQERLSRAIGASDLGVWRINLPFDGSPFYLSPLVRRHFGISDEEEVAMERFLALLHPDDVDMTTEGITRCIADRVPYDVVYRTIAGDGKTRWVRAFGNAFYKEDGTPYQFDGYTLDYTERKETEAGLHASRAKLETLFEMSPAAIAVLRGEDLRFEFVNQIYRTLFTGGRDVVGKPLVEVLPEAVEQGFDRILRDVMETGVPFRRSETEFIVRREGEPVRTVYLDFIYQPMPEAEGATPGVFAHIIDVTDQVLTRREVQQLAETLRHQTGLWDAALSNIADYVWVFDPDVRFRYANRSLLDLWGLQLEQVVGKTCEDLNYPPEVADQLRRDTAEAIRTRRPVAGEVDYTSPTGVTGHFEYIVAPVVGPDGTVESVAGSSHDVAERNATLTALRESEERFRAVQVTNPDPFTILQAVRGEDGEIQDFRWTFVNEATAQLTGETVEELVGALATEKRPGLRETTLYQAWLDTVATGKPFGLEIFMNFPSGRTFLRLTGVRVGDGVAVSFTDLTQRRLNEEKLEAAVSDRTSQLQAAVKEAEAFNYSISHDLRAPLRAMASTSSILLEELGDGLTDEHQTLLLRQSENAQRLGRLIDELLRLSRLARAEVNRREVDVTAQSRAIFDELRRIYPSEKLRFEAQENMIAEADAGLLRTVLENLIGNAMKFSPNGGAIRLAKNAEVFSVSDEGVGFDMRFAPKVFLPFERLVSDDQFEGTGIGLANVERIVRRHGGRVWVESEAAKGSTFFFTLG